MRRARAEAGSVLVFVTVWTSTVLLASGLLYDGGLVLAAHRRAFDVAESAARAGAQEVDPRSLRGGDGTLHLDANRAGDRARSYLSVTGHGGSVVVVDDVVTVEVRINQPVTLLRLFGFGDREVVGVGSSRALRGTTIEGD